MKPEIRQRIEMIRRGEVPEGYKKKCGKVLPLTWDTSKMKEICIINPLRPEVIPEKVVFLSMTDVSEDGKILHQQKVDYQSVKQGFTPFQKGDVLVAKITPCFENGKGAHTENLVTDVGFGSTEFHVLRSKINSTYTFYHTVFENFRKKLEREMTGSAGQKRVQTASLANYSIAVPPAAEQQKIAAILTTQDKVIELKEKRLAEKLRQKKYLMQQLLTGKKRLPGFTFEVEETNIKAISTYSVSTISQTTLDSYEGKRLYPVFNANSIGGYVDFYQNKCPYVSIIKDGAGIGRVRLCEAKSSTIGTMGCIHARKGISIIFLYYLLEQVDFGKYSNGSTIPHLYYKDYSCEKVRVPDLQEQTAIAQVLSTADREISLLRQDIEKEKQKKKALMQLLLTGIVRVNV